MEVYQMLKIWNTRTVRKPKENMVQKYHNQRRVTNPGPNLDPGGNPNQPAGHRIQIDRKLKIKYTKNVQRPDSQFEVLNRPQPSTLTFSPVTRFNSIRAILSDTTNVSMKVAQGQSDIKPVFFQHAEQTIHIRQGKVYNDGSNKETNG